MSARELERPSRPLTLEEVEEDGRPAVFSAYGDHLAYMNGTVYSLSHDPDPCDVLQPQLLSDAYVVTSPAGIEYGWRHLDECDHPRRSGGIRTTSLEEGEPADHRLPD